MCLQGLQFPQVYAARRQRLHGFACDQTETANGVSSTLLAFAVCAAVGRLFLSYQSTNIVDTSLCLTPLQHRLACSHPPDGPWRRATITCARVCSPLSRNWAVRWHWGRTRDDCCSVFFITNVLYSHCDTFCHTPDGKSIPSVFGSTEKRDRRWPLVWETFPNICDRSRKKLETTISVQSVFGLKPSERWKRS